MITMRFLGVSFVFLIILAQAVAFIFFYDLPTKLDTYSKAVGRMREQQDGMKREARHLESERHSLEHEEKALREERERWEKALEDRVPRGAFWDSVWPALECRAYGKREYWGVLQNIPDDWTDLDACMNTPVKIKGVSVRRPDRCAYVTGSPHIHGFWTVDWDQPDCKPWFKGFEDKVSREKLCGANVRLGSRTSVSRVARTRDLVPVASKPGLWASRIYQSKTGI